jgi:hypothetical protein
MLVGQIKNKGVGYHTMGRRDLNLECRLAEFVTKSIDNLSHGLTVKEAMKQLGLKKYVER